MTECCAGNSASLNLVFVVRYSSCSSKSSCAPAAHSNAVRPHPILGHAHLRLTTAREVTPPPAALARSGCPRSVRHSGRLVGRRREREREGSTPSSVAAPTRAAWSVDHGAAAGVFFLAGRGRERGALRDRFLYLFYRTLMCSYVEYFIMLEILVLLRKRATEKNRWRIPPQPNRHRSDKQLRGDGGGHHLRRRHGLTGERAR